MLEKNQRCMLHDKMTDFLNLYNIESSDISEHNEDFFYIKTNVTESFSSETMYEQIDSDKENQYFIVTTLNDFGESPEIKKYLINHNCVNAFFSFIKEPGIEEEILSIESILA